MNKLEKASEMAAGVFAQMGWTWVTPHGEVVPTKEEIYSTMLMLFKSVAEDGESSAETGRLIWQLDEDRWRCFLELTRVPVG